MARAPAPTTTSERAKIARRLAGRRRSSRCDRPRDGRRPAATWITAPSPMKRGVERDRDIACRRELAEMLRDARGSSAASASASEPMLRPAPDRRDRTARRRRRRRRRRGGAPRRRQAARRRLGARLGGARPAARASGLRVAHQRAQIGVFPLLDAAMRQAVASNGANAASRCAATASSPGSAPCARAQKPAASAVSAAVLIGRHFGVHAPHAASS